jgi:hypothetical protein
MDLRTFTLVLAPKREAKNKDSRLSMSFRDLVSGGAECGPSNPLATFGKQFGQDRGAQLDRFGEGAEASGSGRHIVSGKRS